MQALQLCPDFGGNAAQVTPAQIRGNDGGPLTANAMDLGRPSGKFDIGDRAEPYRNARRGGAAPRGSGSLGARRPVLSPRPALGSGEFLTLLLLVPAAVVSALDLVRVLAADNEKIPQIGDVTPLRLLDADQDVNLLVGAGPGGEEILLSQVADFGIVKTPARLQREDRRTYTRVSAFYTGEKREAGREAIRKVMESLSYPQGYGWSFGFWTLREDQDNQAFVFNLLLALFMVYFVMASLFESLAHPLAIILSLPFAAVGVAWFLLLTGTPFNIMAMIGMLVLIGVVVNNGIVLVDHINNLRRGGRPRQQAILEGCRERLRPILMTAATTIVGLIPLAWGDSGLFDMKYFPMARTVMGGLMASTALTLIVLPTYYTLFDDLAIWLKRTWFASDPSRLKPTPEIVGD